MFIEIADIGYQTKESGNELNGLKSPFDKGIFYPALLNHNSLKKKENQMSFLCNSCDEKLNARYHWRGLSVVCPNCGQPTELEYRVGQNIPVMVCSTSFSEFKNTVVNEAFSETMYPVIEKLLNCSIARTKTGVKLIAEDGSTIPLETAHLEIQLNPNSQAIMYNAIMEYTR
jgi:predicted RNA-binding Zn-ribbon protein involved in translation (DUF1610 family)